MKLNFLRFLTAAAAAASALSALDLGGFASFIPAEYLPVLASAALASLAVKECAVVIGDILDNGKRDGSFKG